MWEMLLRGLLNLPEHAECGSQKWPEQRAVMAVTLNCGALTLIESLLGRMGCVLIARGFPGILGPAHLRDPNNE